MVKRITKDHRGESTPAHCGILMALSTEVDSVLDERHELAAIVQDLPEQLVETYPNVEPPRVSCPCGRHAERAEDIKHKADCFTGRARVWSEGQQQSTMRGATQ